MKKNRIDLDASYNSENEEKSKYSNKIIDKIKQEKDRLEILKYELIEKETKSKFQTEEYYNILQ